VARRRRRIPRDGVERILVIVNALAEKTRPLRRVEYDRLVELGFFVDERLELLEGSLVPMSPQGGRHASSIQKLNMALAPALAGHAEVRVQSPFAASDDSEPEPDLAVVPAGDYVSGHPQHALLIIEVTESSLGRDRAKARLYAASGVPEYWLVNLQADVVEVYRSPQAGGFMEMTRHGRGETLRLVAFPDVTVSTDVAIPRRV